MKRLVPALALFAAGCCPAQAFKGAPKPEEHEPQVLLRIARDGLPVRAFRGDIFGDGFSAVLVCGGPFVDQNTDACENERLVGEAVINLD